MWVCIGPLFVAITLLVWWLDPSLRRQRKYEAELADRVPISDEEMLSRFFTEVTAARHVPGQVRRVFAKNMDYSAEKLFPDDDFAFFWEELDMVDLIRDLESGFGITITDREAERTPCTIRGASLLIWEKLRRTNPVT